MTERLSVIATQKAGLSELVRRNETTHDYKIWQVIAASAVGTMIEWYDFYIFGSLASVRLLSS